VRLRRRHGARKGEALSYADKTLKCDRLAAVMENGLALKYADASLRSDREVVMAAVAQDGMAFQYADNSLTRDRDVVLAYAESQKRRRDWRPPM